MNNVTQQDFRNLYPSPDTKKTEEMRRTLAALPDRKESRKESRESRPVLRKRRIAFVLAAALMLIGVTALGVGLINGTVVSWGGEQKPFSDTDISLPPQTVNEYLSTCPDDMYTAVTWNDGSCRTMVKDITRVVESEEELLQILDASGFPYPANLVPDGWSFFSALVEYSCAPDGHYELVSEEELLDGLYTANTYTLSDQYRIITGCVINMEKGSESGRVSISCSTKDMITSLNVVYPVDEGVESRLVSVPGMEEAMVSAYDGHTFVSMYRPLEAPVAVNADGISPDKDIWTLDYQSISFSNVRLEEVIRLFSGTP